jgi:predicted transglutaminase-like protease
MDLNEAIYFRDLFREARAKAYQDAEAFHEILYTLEKFGIRLTNNVEGLYQYWDEIGKVAEKSPLSSNIDREWHLPFNELYELVKDARNDALHQGAFARHLTLHATQLVLILEDALMDNASKVSDFMVREPICAYI